MADSAASRYYDGTPPGSASSSLKRSANDAFESSSELEYPSKRRLTIGSSTDVPLAVSTPTPQPEVSGPCPSRALEEVEKLRTPVAQLESKQTTESNEPGVRNLTISPVEESAMPESSNPSPVFGSDSTAPQLGEDPDQKFKKARDILSKIPRRFDTDWIKMEETHTSIKGGQGVVVIGTLPDAFKEIFPELKVAVKKLEWKRDDVEESAKFFKSFVNELSLMESLSHPNIIMLVGFVEDMQKGDAWMILPWEANGNVREFLQSGEWDIPERISLLKDTAKGLQYLHSQQPPICHGDLKSFNILVNSDYHAVITDFGSARVRRDLAPEKTGNVSAGAPVCENAAATAISPKVEFNASTMELTLTGPKFTTRWTAPEVLNNGVQDLPSDMWALGWVSWEIVTGKIPFDDLNVESVIIVHAIRGKLPAIREDANLSLVLMLCSPMSDCWLSEPAKRIDASTFQLKVDKMPSETPSCYTASGLKVRSAHLLLQLGRTYELQSDQVMAESHFRSALDIASRTKNHLAEANALNCLGHVLYGQSRYLEAEKARTEARDIHCRIGNDTGAANALQGLGSIYRAQSRYREAEAAYTEAHDIYSRFGHDLGTANALSGLGAFYRAQSRYQEAEVAFTEAHEIHSRIGNETGAANALEGLGNVYSLQSRNSEGEKAFTEARDIHCRIGNDPGAANALQGLGDIYHGESRYREAEKAFTEAHKIHSRIGNETGAAYALQGLGKLHSLQSRNSEAEKAFTEAHDIHSRIGNHMGTANALLCLGSTYRAQSRTSEAEIAFNNAHNIYSRIGDVFSTGNVLRSLAMLYSDQCRYGDAEASYRLAAASYDHAGDGDSKARTLLALGKDLHTQRRYPEAEEAATEALAIWISMSKEEGQADASLLLAEIFGSQSRTNEGKQALAQAEAACARIGGDAARAATLDKLGQVHTMLGTYDEAEECFRLAQAIFSSTDDGRGEARALGNLGKFYLVQGRHDEAEECYADARVAFARFGDVNGQAKALDGLMAAKGLQCKFVDAKAVCLEAREMYAQMGQPISGMCEATWELSSILSNQSN